MGEPTAPAPVMLVLVAFSRYTEAIDWAGERAEATWGPILLASPAFAFQETDYYERSMGGGLSKHFFAFGRLIAADDLVEIKLETNRWEAEYAASSGKAEQRPLNLDPGYLTLAKFVLASTKDHAHRLYLGRGIYAEVTLHYKHDVWQHRDYTFPDYRRADYQQFLSQCRQELRRQLRRKEPAE
jgi:hypothetical protein